MISVYYDGKCGLCSKEINFFKRRTPKHPILWHDIANDPAQLEGTGVSQAEALMFMHVRDAEGVMRTEVDAFIALWRQFSGWSFLSRFVSLPGIYQLAGVLYRVFAKVRFNRYPHCQASLEKA
ncbi:thiol-disulfide oxidoreductase DCC family protein [Roseibium sp.]|uniref:thiol-disulfide oxidoreductase DCC family protein n=1 Tax=Roseibium sp. TaxID=1936156 RepID=UPI003BABECEB